MSKVVVRMEMPKSCPCELSAEVFDPSGNYGGYQPCFAWYGIPARSKEFDRCVVRSERPSWCPIVGELPEEHGDLIDRDDAIKEFELYAEYESNRSNAEWVERIKTVLNSMTSVIAAERTDDEQADN